MARNPDNYQRALLWIASHTASDKLGGLAKSRPARLAAYIFDKRPTDIASDVLAFEARARTGVNRTLIQPAHDRRHEKLQPAEA